jgi:hypothetical protein
MYLHFVVRGGRQKCEWNCNKMAATAVICMFLNDERITAEKGLPTHHRLADSLILNTGIMGQNFTQAVYSLCLYCPVWLKEAGFSPRRSFNFFFQFI